MLNNHQIQNILIFPFRDKDAQKNFLIASLVALIGLVIPILPWLALYGYVARIMRQIIHDEQEPSMPAWTDWPGLMRDGLRLIAPRMVIIFPILALMFIALVIAIAPIFFIGDSSASYETAMRISTLSMVANLLCVAIFTLIIIIAVPFGVILGAAEGHVIKQESLSAALHIKEWWPIFRKNISGFIISYLLVQAIGVVGGLVIQALAYTIVLICLLPLLLAPYSAYGSVIMYAFMAKAYAQGRDALQKAAEPNL